MIDAYGNASNNSQMGSLQGLQQAGYQVAAYGAPVAAPAQPISSDLAMTADALARAHSLVLEIANRFRGPRPEAVGDQKAPATIIDMARANRQRTETLVDYLAELLSAL